MALLVSRVGAFIAVVVPDDWCLLVASRRILVRRRDALSPSLLVPARDVGEQSWVSSSTSRTLVHTVSVAVSVMAASLGVVQVDVLPCSKEDGSNNRTWRSSDSGAIVVTVSGWVTVTAAEGRCGVASSSMGGLSLSRARLDRLRRGESLRVVARGIWCCELVTRGIVVGAARLTESMDGATAVVRVSVLGVVVVASVIVSEACLLFEDSGDKRAVVLFCNGGGGGDCNDAGKDAVVANESTLVFDRTNDDFGMGPMTM
jgi:hypothetical protein